MPEGFTKVILVNIYPYTSRFELVIGKKTSVLRRKFYHSVLMVRQNCVKHLTNVKNTKVKCILKTITENWLAYFVKFSALFFLIFYNGNFQG